MFIEAQEAFFHSLAREQRFNDQIKGEKPSGK